MKGSIQKRGKGYAIRYDLGLVWDEKKKTHVRKQKFESVPWKERKNTVIGKSEWVAPNKTDAQDLLAKRLAQINEGEYVEPTDMTFVQFKDEWMREYAEAGDIRPSTLTLYRGLFKKHIIPAFGGKPLAKIDTRSVQQFKTKMLKEGKEVVNWVKDEEGNQLKETTYTGLSPQTVKHMLRLMRQMFDHAIDWKYIKTNPAKKVDNPKIEKKEMDTLTPQEVRLLLDKLPQRWYAFFLTAIVTGLRIGELIAMRWDNLDWNRGQYFVKETWLRSREGRKASFSVPKTPSSIAPVDLTPTCLEALKAHRQTQAAERLNAGEDYQDQGLIFVTPKGTPLDDRHIVNRTFLPTLKDAGIRTIRFHDLRHTTASLLINQGESPKYIQKQLRHSSIEITFDRYGHLFPDANKEAARRFDDALFGKQAVSKPNAQ